MAKRNTQPTQPTQPTQAAPAEPVAQAAPAATQAAPAEPAPVVLADNIVGALRADGIAAQELEASLQNFATLFAKVMRRDAQHPGNFPLYRAMAWQWRVGFDYSARGMADASLMESIKPSEASQDAFERRIKAARALGLLQGDIPRSESAEATKKAAQRALPDGTVEQWAEKLAAAQKAGDVKAIAAASGAMVKLQDAAARDAKKAANEKLRALREKARKLLGDITATDDEKLIGKAIAALQKIAPAKAATAS